MYKQVEMPKKDHGSTNRQIKKSASHSIRQKKSIGFVDNRSESVAQWKLQGDVSHSSQVVAQKKSNAVIQRAEPEDSINVIQLYFTDAYNHYGKALIEQVCTAKGLRVHAHGSGSSGDGINAATNKEMKELLPHLQAAKKAKSKTSEPEKKKVVDKSKMHNPFEMAEAAEKKEQDKKRKAAAKKANHLANNKK